MSSVHFKTVCMDCEEIVDQCRCPAKDKQINYVICDKCKKKSLEKLKKT